MPRDHAPHQQRGSTIEAVPVPRLSTLRMPPRRFGMGKRIQYGEVTIGASPGGVGKTSLALLEAIAWVTGRPLTGEFVKPRGNAWLITAEESAEEMYRRALAICRFFGIDPDDLAGKLFITSTRDTAAFRVVAIGEGGKLVDTDAPDDVVDQCEMHNIGLLSVDPFVTTHEAEESDNGAMDRVARRFNYIAQKADIAVVLYHHVVKDDNPEAHVGNLARVRGAGGIINAVRHAFTLAGINKETQEQYGLTDEEAVRIMRMDAGLKGNYVLRQVEPMWFWRESITLDNAEYDEDGRLVWEADEVGVLRPFSMVNLVTERQRIADDAKEPERDAVAQEIADAMPVDRLLVSDLLPRLAAVIEGKLTKQREVIADAIPLAPGCRRVTVAGQPGRIWRVRTKAHETAPVEIVRQVDP